MLLTNLEGWAAAFGKRLSPNAIAWWTRLFADEKPWLLAKALDQVTRTCERMPAPGHLTKAIGQVKESMPAPPARREAKQDCKVCQGTGFEIVTRPSYGLPYVPKVAVPCKCRSQNAAQAPSPYSYHKVVVKDSENGKDVDAIVYDDAPETVCFKATDCKEGREFMAMLAKWKAEGVPSPMTEAQVTKERNRQKAAFAASKPALVGPTVTARPATPVVETPEEYEPTDEDIPW